MDIGSISRRYAETKQAFRDFVEKSLYDMFSFFRPNQMSAGDLKGKDVESPPLQPSALGSLCERITRFFLSRFTSSKAQN